MALKKHIHLTVHTEEGAADDYVMALDAEKMERVYFNLLSNAFKFTPENGSVAVELSVVRQEGKDCARLVVTDTGSGISEQHIRHIFERFYQTDVNHAGSGIGLALVKAFVELHGGTISVESAEGKGTVFTVDIPVNRWEGQAAAEVE